MCPKITKTEHDNALQRTLIFSLDIHNKNINGKSCLLKGKSNLSKSKIQVKTNPDHIEEYH